MLSEIAVLEPDVGVVSPRTGNKASSIPYVATRCETAISGHKADLDVLGRGRCKNKALLHTHELTAFKVCCRAAENEIDAAEYPAVFEMNGTPLALGELLGLFGQTFEAIAGYNPTFDVVEMLKTAFGWGDDEEEEKPLSERLKSAADQLVDALPYVNILTGGGRIPIASGIPNLVGVATGGTDQYGNELTLEDEMKKLLYLIPPTGGNQFKKTTQGLSMFDEELPVSGSYTDSGNLRFPVEDTLGNRIQASVFGQWASENARD